MATNDENEINIDIDDDNEELPTTTSDDNKIEIDDNDGGDGSYHNTTAVTGVNFVEETATTDDVNKIDIDESEDGGADSSNDEDSDAHANVTGFKKARLKD